MCLVSRDEENKSNGGYVFRCFLWKLGRFVLVWHDYTGKLQAHVAIIQCLRVPCYSVRPVDFSWRRILWRYYVFLRICLVLQSRKFFHRGYGYVSYAILLKRTQWKCCHRQIMFECLQGLCCARWDAVYKDLQNFEMKARAFYPYQNVAVISKIQFQ